MNTQCLSSSYDEFSLMLQNHQFDIISLSKTWLTGNPQQISFVTIPGYRLEHQDRGSRGGSVGFFIKDTITYKLREDLRKVDTSIEHQWLEIKGRNKNSSYL